MKLRNVRRMWRLLIAVGIVLLCLVLVPTVFTLNSMRDKIEIAFTDQTGVSAKINGDVHFSLLGRANIVAHDIAIPNGHISSVRFAVPLWSMFDIQNAKLDDKITVYGARIAIERLIPITMNYDIDIHNSIVRFLEKDYEIVSGKINQGNFSGTIRTDQHKYEINYSDGKFLVENNANNLSLTGEFSESGGAHGKISMETQNVNKWFQFRTPKISGNMRFSSDFDWDGGWGIKFNNITANNYTGNIELMPNGEKYIQLRAHNIDYDFSFLMNPNKIFYKTTFDLDFYGNLTLANHEFGHLKVNAVGTQSQIQIGTIIADDVSISNGTIDIDGAHNIMISLPFDGQMGTCVFSGTPESWNCREFTYGNITGAISVGHNNYKISLKSPDPMPEYDALMSAIRRLGTRGILEMEFADIAGTLEINGNTTRAKYNYVYNKPLNWVAGDLDFIPNDIQKTVGDFTWTGDMMEFIPKNNRWKISMYDNYFYVYGENIKDLFPNVDLQAINDMAYTIVGKHKGKNISDLTIKIAGHEFTGSANGTNITLNTDVLLLDSFINPNFINNYQEREFLTNAPIMQLFNLPINVSLTANSMIYNDDEFRNFIYALKPNIQTFSVSDDNRGNVLANISRDKNNYNIFMQLNRFATRGYLLNTQMPLNIRDSRITAEINMRTSGQIAHDIFYNLAGEMDLSFDGGYLIGIGTDDFYANAANITTMNSEYALTRALSGGESELKSLHIIGVYNSGNFKTTQPVEFSLRHTDGRANLEITDGRMHADIQMIMRGTSPDPKPVGFAILPDSSRQYSISQITNDFDASFLREFIKTHNRF